MFWDNVWFVRFFMLCLCSYVHSSVLINLLYLLFYFIIIRYIYTSLLSLTTKLLSSYGIKHKFYNANQFCILSFLYKVSWTNHLEKHSWYVCVAYYKTKTLKLKIISNIIDTFKINGKLTHTVTYITYLILLCIIIYNPLINACRIWKREHYILITIEDMTKWQCHGW